MKKFFFLLFFLPFFQYSFSQRPQPANGTEIYQAIEKLNFLGSVLYVAAHPDDENTQLISYFSNNVHARTGYLSLTRGDGGQNLIGPELRELLGAIRTQELLAARRIDGGEQFFTRANDFGYSKTPKETMSIWDKEAVLSDMIWVMRKFQPDVIINRFDTESAGKTHGHHTTSAILSAEAFDLANNPKKFPEQLEHVDPWQPKRMYFNASWWFYGSKEKFKKAMKNSNLLSVDVGVYYPMKGVSNSEIAALSRSQHKTQGFGVAGSRGSEMEYLQRVKGDFSENSSSVFDGIDTSWGRLENGKPIGELLAEVQQEYDFKNPSASIPKLLEAYALIQKLENSHWKKIKSTEIKDIILSAAGIFLEVSTENETAVPGEEINLSMEAINRSSVPVTLKNIHFTNSEKNRTLSEVLPGNKDFKLKTSLQLPDSLAPSNPYWLNEEGSLGMYKVKNQQFIGLAQSPTALNSIFELSINGISLLVEKPLVYKTTDPAKGEVYKSFRIVPKASVSLENKVIVFNSSAPKTVFVKVKAFQDHLKGNLTLSLPEKWRISPENIDVHLPAKGMEKSFSFTIFPPKTASEAYLQPILTSENVPYSKELVVLEYPHIPSRQILLPTKTKILRLDIQKKGEKVAYITGAGDVVPKSLEQMGYKVHLFSPEEITSAALSGYDAVVTGIRAYNIFEDLDSKQRILFDFVKNGGNMIVQYNTNSRLKTTQLAPYELQLSRDRVTDENSEVKFLAPEHSVLNFPNKITQKDFQGWVQERGLYFPDQWGKEFIPILGMKDEGESIKKGSLLVAKYGKGYYIYTGLSFFREFPAGVSGAYRLFANLLSLGK